MNKYKNFANLLLIFLISLSASCLAATNNIKLEQSHIDQNDLASLQRGAKYFINYCSGCHSLSYLRYQRMAKDLHIVDSEENVLNEVIKDNLMFNTKDIHAHILSSMNKTDGAQWFGVAPPDLTEITKYRSPDWVYTYLKSFYLDKNRPWGVNNLVFKDVAMPNVLAPLQGQIKPIYANNGNDIINLELIKAGKLSPQDYQNVLRDIVNFLYYAADPNAKSRVYIGGWVILFLAFMLILVALLKREYWKDIH